MKIEAGPPTTMRTRYNGDNLTYFVPRDYKAWLQQYEKEPEEQKSRDDRSIFMAYNKGGCDSPVDTVAPQLLFTTEFRADTVAEAHEKAKAWADPLVAPRVVIPSTVICKSDDWTIMLRPDMDGALDIHKLAYEGLINLVLQFDSSYLVEYRGWYCF